MLGTKPIVPMLSIETAAALQIRRYGYVTSNKFRM